MTDDQWISMGTFLVARGDFDAGPYGILTPISWEMGPTTMMNYHHLVI